MKKQPAKAGHPSSGKDQVSELLILPDGRILVHNLTPAFARLLHELNPDAEQISSRTTPHSSTSGKSGGVDLPVSPVARQHRPARFSAPFRNH